MPSHEDTQPSGRPKPAARELPVGTTIGVYRIDGVLGRGAMGVVYRATDTKLNRAVAIKFLAADIGDENARWRFQQEAATTTSLNHPHIVTVHDVGEHDGRRYIVSEIVDGGTLEDWLAAPRKHAWRQTVELLVGVADAIATAHAAGVLHRDIKPGNILLDGNGYAKLADFGIAKLVEQQTAATGVGHATARGVVIGTVAYMSPEQASGLPLDSRSDVFSFGVVLYEALAGKRPFEGANDLETLKAIAHVAPPPLSPEIPEQLRNAVERALEKDPADRYQSIRELAIELKRVARRTTETGPRAPMPATGHAGVALWAIGGGIALTALAIAVPWALKLQRQPQRPAEIRYEMPAPNYAPGSENLAISPDGKQLAYLISIDGKEQVYVRPIGSLAGHTIPGADNGTALFWSPDSRALVFLLNGELTRVDLDGDALRALAPASVVAARGSWSHDGTILFSAPPESDGVGVIGSLPASGGRANRLTTVDIANKELFHGYPTFLPDGKHFLYVRQHQPPTPATLFLASLDDPSGMEIGSAGTISPSTTFNVGYNDGYVLLLRNGTLLAQRLDLGARKLAGSPATVAENVSAFSISATGVLAYRAGEPPIGESRQLVWYDRQGNRAPIRDAPPNSSNPRLSPDDTQIVVDTSGGTLRAADLWSIDVARSVPTRLTFDPANEDVGLWSLDGKQIVFGTARGGSQPYLTHRLVRRAANGTGDEELLYETESPTYAAAPVDWSPDGHYLLFAQANAATFATVSEIWILSMSGAPAAAPLLQTPFRVRSATVSPDGAWLAYSTTESGTDQIMVQSFPDTSRGKWRISAGGGTEPRWRRDGRELYFLTPDGTMMVAAVTPDAATFRYEPPRALFNTDAKVSIAPGFYYDVTRDGQRFVVNEPGQDQKARQESPSPPIEVIVNWRPPGDAR